MVKYLHIRIRDVNGDLQTHGGATIAYTTTKKDIFVHMALCHESYDAFNYRVGRLIAAGRLRKYGAMEVLELKHPITNTIIEWFSKKALGYEIEVKWDAQSKRWTTDFIPVADAVFEMDSPKGPKVGMDVPADVQELECDDCSCAPTSSNSKAPLALPAPKEPSEAAKAA